MQAGSRPLDDESRPCGVLKTEPGEPLAPSQADEKELNVRHSPAPWTAEEYGNSRADGSQPWAVFAKDTDPDASPGDRIMLAECLTEADARLIAEAPAMLDTLKLAYRCCRVVHGEQSELCRTIQRTIAAAEPCR